MTTTLYQTSSTGKTKFLEFSTNGPEFITTWGLMGCKTQTTVKVCEGMNIGKSNEKTPAQQAILEMEAKIVKKMKEGYRLELGGAEASDDPTTLDLDNLPRELCPNKPISKLPASVEKDPQAYGQRKHNGHCLILVRGEGDPKVYTRRMEDITAHTKDIPVIAAAIAKLPEGSFLIFECVYYSNQYKKEMPRFVAQVITNKDRDEALRRFHSLRELGEFSLIPLDALYIDGIFVGSMIHVARYQLLKRIGFNPPELLQDWLGAASAAKSLNWEGFVVRKPDETSCIGFTMDGKAKRAGGWKYKFLGEGDFVVSEVERGLAGKHAGFYARFKVHQYDPAGAQIDRGWVGAGTLTHDVLAELTADIAKGSLKLPFVVEIEYQSIHDESGKLEFGQIQRLRHDKTPEECISDD